MRNEKFMFLSWELDREEEEDREKERKWDMKKKKQKSLCNCIQCFKGIMMNMFMLSFYFNKDPV